jgi:hypothetical protein
MFRAILASESHWLQPMLVLSVHWWSTLAGVGRVKVFGQGFVRRERERERERERDPMREYIVLST